MQLVTMRALGTPLLILPTKELHASTAGHRREREKGGRGRVRVGERRKRGARGGRKGGRGRKKWREKEGKREEIARTERGREGKEPGRSERDVAKGSNSICHDLPRESSNAGSPSYAGAEAAQRKTT